METSTETKVIEEKQQSLNESDLKLSKSDSILVYSVCVLAGTLAFFVFYQVALSARLLSTLVWPGASFYIYWGGVEYSVAGLVSIALLPRNGFKLSFFYISSAMYVVICIAFPWIVTAFAGLENYTTALILILVLAFLCGIADALQFIMGFSLAATLPKSAVGLVSGGAAFSGAIPFIAVLLLKVSFSPSIENTQRLVWTFFPLGIVVSILQLILVVILSRRQWFLQLFEDAKLRHEAEVASGQDILSQLLGNRRNQKAQSNNHTYVEGRELEENKKEQHEMARAFKYILKDCWKYSLASIILVMITLTVYPAVAPMRIAPDHVWETILQGVGHFGHTVARFAPVYLKCLQIKRAWLLPLSILRSVFFLVLFCIIAKCQVTAVVRAPWFLVLCLIGFSTTHGWLITVADLYTVHSVTNPQEKTIISKVLAICQLFASGSSQFLSKLVILFL